MTFTGDARRATLCSFHPYGLIICSNPAGHAFLKANFLLLMFYFFLVYVVACMDSK